MSLLSCYIFFCGEFAGGRIEQFSAYYNFGLKLLGNMYAIIDINQLNMTIGRCSSSYNQRRVLPRMKIHMSALNSRSRIKGAEKKNGTWIKNEFVKRKNPRLSWLNNIIFAVTNKDESLPNTCKDNWEKKDEFNRILRPNVIQNIAKQIVIDSILFLIKTD